MARVKNTIGNSWFDFTSKDKGAHAVYHPRDIRLAICESSLSGRGQDVIPDKVRLLAHLEGTDLAEWFYLETGHEWWLPNIAFCNVFLCVSLGSSQLSTVPGDFAASYLPCLAPLQRLQSKSQELVPLQSSHCPRHKRDGSVLGSGRLWGVRVVLPFWHTNWWHKKVSIWN